MGVKSDLLSFCLGYLDKRVTMCLQRLLLMRKIVNLALNVLHFEIPLRQSRDFTREIGILMEKSGLEM